MVTAKDASGNAAVGYTGTVHLTTTDSAAQVPPNYTFASADAGSHRFAVTFHTPGNQVVTATDTATSSITGSQAVTVVQQLYVSNEATSSVTTYPSGGAAKITAHAATLRSNTSPPRPLPHP